jgi:hypothetical protein
MKCSRREKGVSVGVLVQQITAVHTAQSCIPLQNKRWHPDGVTCLDRIPAA